MSEEKNTSLLTETHFAEQHLKKRHRSERRFRLLGICSLTISLVFLIVFIISIVRDAAPAFSQTEIQLTVNYDTDVINLKNIDKNDEHAVEQALFKVNYNLLIERALAKLSGYQGENPNQLRQKLLSSSAQYQLMNRLQANPDLIGKQETLWLAASGGIDSAHQGYVDSSIDEANRAVDDQTVKWAQRLHEQGLLRTSFNTTIFTHTDSRSPQDAGVRGAIIGSAYTLLVTLALSFPIAVLAAIYLEEFAPKNRFTDFLEANINNLAAVPSIIFGLLGLAVFINFFGLPRSTPLVGGLVLTLMTLPTIIISSRAALKAVPPSIRAAALGLGASKMQVTFHHVLPLAMPGMLTGTIIGMAQALGETAPLLMIGMVAFISDVPNGILDPAAVMPVQIYLWSDLPERAFIARTSFAIIILLFFLIAMNALAVILRKKFERKW